MTNEDFRAIKEATKLGYKEAIQELTQELEAKTPRNKIEVKCGLCAMAGFDKCINEGGKSRYQ